MISSGHVVVRLLKRTNVPCEVLPLDGRVKRVTNSRAIVRRAELGNKAIFGRQWRC